MTKTLNRKTQPVAPKDDLLALRNVGLATRENFRVLGIEKHEQLKEQDADDLFGRLCAISGERVDPCVLDVFSAVIHQL